MPAVELHRFDPVAGVDEQIDGGREFVLAAVARWNDVTGVEDDRIERKQSRLNEP